MEVWTFFAFMMLAMVLFFIGDYDAVQATIDEAEEEPDRRRRLEILRKADKGLGYNHPELLLRLAQAAMAVAYEEASWGERRDLAGQAIQVANRATKTLQKRQVRRPLTKSEWELLCDLKSAYRAAEECETEALRQLLE